MSSCSTCGAPIRWARTQHGRSIPLDPDPVPGGNLVVVDPGVVDIVAFVTPFDSTLFGDDQPRFVTHFATCPNADQHRKTSA